MHILCITTEKYFKRADFYILKLFVIPLLIIIITGQMHHLKYLTYVCQNEFAEGYVLQISIYLLGECDQILVSLGCLDTR